MTVVVVVALSSTVVLAVGWWSTCGVVVVEDGENKDGGLQEIFEVFVCACVCA